MHSSSHTGGNAYRHPDPLVRPPTNPFERRANNAQQMAIPRPSCGIPHRTLQSGVSFTPSGGRARSSSTAHPFQVIGAGDGGKIRKGLLFDGLTEHVPDSGGGPMDDLQEIDLSSGGVWLHVEWQPSTSDGDLLSGGEAQNVELVTSPGSGSLPTVSENGHIYIHLWEAGVGQYWTTSIRLQFCQSIGYIASAHGS